MKIYSKRHHVTKSAAANDSIKLLARNVYHIDVGPMDAAGFTENEIEDAVTSMNEDFDTLRPRGNKGDPGPGSRLGEIFDKVDQDLRVPNSYYVDSVQWNLSTIPYQHL